MDFIAQSAAFLAAAILVVPVFRRLGLGDVLGYLCAISDREVSLNTVEHIRESYPHVRIYARARDRQHEINLRARGATVAMRDTLHSSLHVSEDILLGLGFGSADARETVEVFRQHDADTLDKQFDVRTMKMPLSETRSRSRRSTESPVRRRS